MSVEVLHGKVIHQVRHDLESFFWLLLWIVLRYTDHRNRDAYLWLRTLFDQESELECANAKRGFLGSGFDIRGNEPLTYLVQEFSELCEENLKANRRAKGGQQSHLLTYDSVLSLLDEVIARDDWPVDDEAIPFLPADSNQRVHVAQPTSDWRSSRDSLSASGHSRASALINVS